MLRRGGDVLQYAVAAAFGSGQSLVSPSAQAIWEAAQARVAEGGAPEVVAAAQEVLKLVQRAGGQGRQ